MPTIRTRLALKFLAGDGAMTGWQTLCNMT